MSTTQLDDGLSDPLYDLDAGIDDGEYARIMRRVNGGEDGAGTQVSAFNSSI